MFWNCRAVRGHNHSDMPASYPNSREWFGDEITEWSLRDGMRVSAYVNFDGTRGDVYTPGILSRMALRELRELKEPYSKIHIDDARNLLANPATMYDRFTKFTHYGIDPVTIDVTFTEEAARERHAIIVEIGKEK
jgi:hypothetical protein